MTLPTIQATGNLAADPELRFTQGGDAVCNFRIACTERRFDRQAQEWTDGDTTWLTVSMWKAKGEAVAERLRKGSRVIVTGKLRQRDWEKDGVKRTSFEVAADEVAEVVRPPRQSAPQYAQSSEAPF